MAGKKPDVSVIIPTLNEESNIHDVLVHCRELRPQPELIVVDGDSRDQTVDMTRKMGVLAIRSPRRGRSFQMNVGASVATGETLVFLHADTRLNQRAWDGLHRVLQDSEIDYGAFQRRYPPPSSFVLSLFCQAANWRGRLTHIFLGDQTIFVRRAAFERVGGYREILLFEDLELCTRLRSMCKGMLIEQCIETSRRRFDAEGSISRYGKNIILWVRYLLGADPNELARRYYPGYFTEPPSQHPAPRKTRATKGTSP